MASSIPNEYKFISTIDGTLTVTSIPYQSETELWQ